MTQTVFDIDPRESKLPKWVQDKFNELRMIASNAQSLLQDFRNGTETGPFWLTSYADSDKRMYLPQNQRLVWGNPCLVEAMSGGHLTLEQRRKTPGWLTVRSNGRVIVTPETANMLRIKSGDLFDAPS